MRICVNPECPDVIGGYAEYADATETCVRCGKALEHVPEKEEEQLVTVFRAPEQGQVRLLADLLRDAGLTVYVYGQHEALTGGGYSMMDQWRTASIQVPEEEAEEARGLIAVAETQGEFSDEEGSEGEEKKERETAPRVSAQVPVTRVGLPFALTLFVALPVLLLVQHFVPFDQNILLAILLVFAGAAFWAGHRYPGVVSQHYCGKCGQALSPTQGFCDGCDRRLVEGEEGAS
ncbi:MAG: hypothetical protein P1V51_06220 [Deltaproteobacteria bacterium]|nr:hypothetical protein [Deltaproteobacteria bacterium]